jgi:hypothetical protein
MKEGVKNSEYIFEQTNPFFLCGPLCRSVARNTKQTQFPHFQSKNGDRQV